MYHAKAKDSKGRSFKRAIFLFGLLTLLLCFYNLSDALVSDNSEDGGMDKLSPVKQLIMERREECQGQKPEYAPGEVIIKLKEKESPQLAYTQSYSERAASQEDTLSNIKAKYNLRDEKPVVHRQNLREGFGISSIKYNSE